MLVWAFFEWWYGAGWRDLGNRMVSQIQHTYLDFSVPIILRTLFAPWRRIITYPGGSLGQKMRAVLDNAVSRCVGFGVRVIALAACLVLILLNMIIGGITLILWPVVPAAGIILLFWGLL